MIFVTGISSFVGRSLERALIKNKIKYLGIDLKVDNKKNKKVLDLRSKKLKNIIPINSTVIHLAAISTDKDCKNDERLAFDVNVNGTINLIEAAKIRKVSKIIFASTEWVYGDKANKAEQKEIDNINIGNLNSTYALTKIIGEKMLLKSNSFFKTIILRFGIIYGPRKNNWSALESIFFNCINSVKVEIGSKKTSRRFIHIDDLVQGILLSIKYPKSGIFNLSGNKDISLENIIFSAKKMLKKDIKIIEKTSKKFTVRKPSNRLAKQKLKWLPKIDLNQGLKELNFFLVNSNCSSGSVGRKCKK
jgi:nucleoside-diphosphate-sugar epimerase